MPRSRIRVRKEEAKLGESMTGILIGVNSMSLSTNVFATNSDSDYDEDDGEEMEPSSLRVCKSTDEHSTDKKQHASKKENQEALVENEQFERNNHTSTTHSIHDSKSQKTKIKFMTRKKKKSEKKKKTSSKLKDVEAMNMRGRQKLINLSQKLSHHYRNKQDSRFLTASVPPAETNPKKSSDEKNMDDNPKKPATASSSRERISRQQKSNIPSSHHQDDHGRSAQEQNPMKKQNQHQQNNQTAFNKDNLNTHHQDDHGRSAQEQHPMKKQNINQHQENKCLESENIERVIEPISYRIQLQKQQEQLFNAKTYENNSPLICSKYNTISCISLGRPGQQKQRPHHHVRNGLKLSSIHLNHQFNDKKYNTPRKKIMSHSTGCIVMEGPSPQDDNDMRSSIIESPLYNALDDPIMWMVSISFAEEKKSHQHVHWSHRSVNDVIKNLSLIQNDVKDIHNLMESFQEIHAQIYYLIQEGNFSNAALTLLMSEKNLFDGNHSSDRDNKHQINGSSSSMYIQNMKRIILRNIGTIHLLEEKYKDAAYYFHLSIKSQLKYQYQKTKILYPQDIYQSNLDLSASFSMYALSLYALGHYNEASKALSQVLDVMSNVNENNYYSCGDGSNESFELKGKVIQQHHYYATGIIFNNKACCMAASGQLTNAAHSFHRSILVYLNGHDKFHYMDNDCDASFQFDDMSVIGDRSCISTQDDYSIAASVASSKCSRLKHSHSLSATLRFLKSKCNMTKLVPTEYLLDASITFMNLACVLTQVDREDYAIICMKQALLLQRKVYHKSHNLVLSTTESLGYLYVLRGQYKKTIRMYEEILRLEESDFLENGNENYYLVMVKTLTDMYLLYKKMNRNESAIWCLQGKIAHLEACLPPDHIELVKSKELLELELSNDLTPANKEFQQMPQSTNEKNLKNF